jgi:hypothetical protein
MSSRWSNRHFRVIFSNFSKTAVFTFRDHVKSILIADRGTKAERHALDAYIRLEPSPAVIRFVQPMWRRKPCEKSGLLSEICLQLLSPEHLFEKDEADQMVGALVAKCI